MNVRKALFLEAMEQSATAFDALRPEGSGPTPRISWT
jgi:hypothetical protein